jgi:spore germination protein GerM
LLALVVAVAGCGLPSDGAPRQIADDKVPFELLGPSTTTPNSDVPGGPIVQLYFVVGTAPVAELRAVTRRVPSLDTQTVLNELVKGLTDTDPLDVTTAIPKDMQVLSVANDGDTVVVTLSNAITTIGGTEQKNAFGQMVYTVADLGTVRIRFRVTDASGGNAQDVPVPTDGGAKAEPVTRSDFISLQPK